MKKIYVDFINLLHGYLIRVKEIHWSAEKYSTHKLCDEVQDGIMGLEDRFSECAMGVDGEEFKIGDLKPYLPNATDLEGMLKELEGDVLSIQKKLKPGKESGLLAICDELVELCCKYSYLAKQK